MSAACIAGVEVSTDNGASWHPATGDENWTYTWSPQLAGTYTIRSRAVDDSINLETPSAGRTVTVTGPNYVTLFSAYGDTRDGEHYGCQRGRTRHEVPKFGGRHGQRHPLLQEQPGHRRRIPARSGRAPARSWRRSPSPTKRPAAGRPRTSPARSRSRRARPTRPPITPMSATTPTRSTISPPT